MKGRGLEQAALVQATVAPPLGAAAIMEDRDDIAGVGRRVGLHAARSEGTREKRSENYASHRGDSCFRKLSGHTCRCNACAYHSPRKSPPTEQGLSCSSVDRSIAQRTAEARL